MKDVRIQKVLSEQGVCSRRAAEQIIREGRVKLNGHPVTVGDKMDTSRDLLTVDGQRVYIPRTQEHLYIMLHKPRGYITTTSDERGRKTVMDLLTDLPARVFPVGRLDKDSEGLLLLTSDGEIVNKILRAAGGHEKEYLVTVNKPIDREFLRKMAAGVPILDTVTLPCKIEQTGKNSFRLILVQGLNRQIRRMCEALGYRVTKLTRVRIMNIRLGHLLPGHWRNLTSGELRELMRRIDSK